KLIQRYQALFIMYSSIEFLLHKGDNGCAKTMLLLDDGMIIINASVIEDDMQ
ncbi:hypothetical protein Tco_1445366, partial [Tanacetum coccineum]